MKHLDVMFGTAGAIATISLSAINVFLGFIAGALTVGILILRFRREWNHRNDPPTDT